jgi:nucleosome binding factor SPN SPT16 subunit
MRNASRACSGLMSEYFVEEMSEVLDENKPITHNSLSKKIDEKIDDAKFFRTLKNIPSGFEASQLDWAYPPCVQSGGKFNIKSHVEPDQNNLHPGVIIADFGLRYKSYSSVVSRTYLVDPSKSQESNYKLLYAVHESILKDIREGVIVKDLYNRALGMVKAKKPDLEQHFLKNIGSAIGLELKDSNFLLNGKNVRPLKDGMTLCITTGFSDIQNTNAKDKKAAVYSLVISDTVRVTRTEAAVFTKDATNDPDMISFYFKEPEEPTPKKDSKKESRTSTVVPRNIIKTKLRQDRPVKVDETAEARRREHQKELAQKRQKAGLERYAEATGDKTGVDKKKFKRFESYKRDGQLPSKIKDLAIFVDVKASTIILPIMGRPVPFHINTIKNASKSDEGEYAYLRINFLSPGQGVGRKDDQPFEDASAHFVRSLTFRSKDTDRMADIAQQITDVRKDTVRREQEKKQMEDVVEQDKLVEIRNRRPARLPDVFVRPALDGKRVPGEVEIHQNGLRYNNPMRAEKIDIPFSNMKHLFFQPCQGELIVLIHVHLDNPIMIGKRKTKDVQFYREATEMQFDETGNRKRKHRYGDEEEFEAEQEERRRRAALDREFKAFAEKISEAVTRDDNRLDVDIPFRDLGFNGVPHRSSVLVTPTTDCIVQLTEPPFMVVTLEDIEIVHLERVQVRILRSIFH